MFLKVGGIDIKVDTVKYVVSVGYLIPDDEKLEELKSKPEFIYSIEKELEDGKLEIVEPNENSIFKQLDTTAKIYIKGFIDGCSYYNEVYGPKPANDNKTESSIITEK